MVDLISVLQSKNIAVPQHLIQVLKNCKKYTVYNSVDELAVAAVGGENNTTYECKYDIPGKGVVTEAIVHKVTNGVSANFTEPYMRRRDPDTMVVADNFPTDKIKFKDKFGYEFSVLQKETFDWLESTELALFFYFAGNKDLGVGGVAIAPANAGFFALGLGLLQRIIPISELPDGFPVESIVYAAPTFRHTHFNGKQIVVHYRSESCHEIYSYNLYPGPSAKKGLYGALLTKGEREGWVTTHCSTVQAISPYDNITTFMHEGASGGGKSEMLQHLLREENGHIMIGENLITKEQRSINFPIFATFNPVTDDMGICHPSIQKNNGKLAVVDAEFSWFIRVDGIKNYGDDPALEKVTIKPKMPLMFLNVKSNPGCTALIWDHIEDEPGKPCPNPRVIIPRSIIPHAINEPVSIDIRSFGVRTPPSSAETPNYGIIGMFHVLPPALAWLWRLVAPRGHGNPSITSSNSKNMESEGVGSYWPFAAGKMVDHANLLLDQILATPNTKYTLVPNQHIGVWKVGFKPQLLMREYLTRRGNGKLKYDQISPARCPLLGYELNYLTIEGAKIPSRFLQVYRQQEVGFEGYDAGAKILTDFFKRELPKFLTPELNPLGRKLIEACLNDASIEEYNEILPMN